MDTNPLKSPTSPEETKARGPLARIDDALGFGVGLIDKWVFVYAASTAINGIGFGILLNEYLRTRQLQFDYLIIVAIFLFLSGLVLGNIAHTVLKNKAKEGFGHTANSDQSQSPASPDPPNG